MTPEEQWQEDVKQFGDLAYLMWKISIFGKKDDDFVDSCDNDNAYTFIKTLYAKRKQSAALDFDEVAAMAGDEVECKISNNWIDCKFHAPFSKNSFVVIDEMGDSLIVNANELRMKHPHRVGVDYSKFED